MAFTMICSDIKPDLIVLHNGANHIAMTLYKNADRFCLGMAGDVGKGFLNDAINGGSAGVRPIGWRHLPVLYGVPAILDQITRFFAVREQYQHIETQRSCICLRCLPLTFVSRTCKGLMNVIGIGCHFGYVFGIALAKS